MSRLQQNSTLWSQDKCSHRPLAFTEGHHFSVWLQSIRMSFYDKNIYFLYHTIPTWVADQAVLAVDYPDAWLAVEKWASHMRPDCHRPHWPKRNAHPSGEYDYRDPPTLMDTESTSFYGWPTWMWSRLWSWPLWGVFHLRDVLVGNSFLLKEAQGLWLCLNLNSGNTRGRRKPCWLFSPVGHLLYKWEQNEEFSLNTFPLVLTFMTQ